MNDFIPKEIHKASQYLQGKLEELENTAKKSGDADDKVEEKVKQSKLKQFVNSIFKR